MTANPAPERPLEPTVAPTPSIHDRHVGAIAAWLAEKSTTDLVVEVVTGPNRVQVARGRYVDLQAHPGAKGVYRLVFDNSKAGPDAPPGEQWVAVGHELVDVAAGDASLILDKGSQRIEVHVLGAPGVSEAEAEAPQLTLPAAAQAATPVAASGLAPAGGASILETYAPAVEAVAHAPMYQNAGLLGSRLFGETRLEVVGDELHVTARRMRHGTAFFVLTGIVLGAFVLAGAMLYAIQLLNVRSSGILTPSDDEYLRYTMYGTLVVAGTALLFYLVGRLISAGTQPERIVAPLGAVAGRKHRRLFFLRGPVGRKGRRRRLVLKPAGQAERARLMQLLTHLRG